MDTSPEILRAQAAIMRRMGPRGRLERCLAWSWELIAASQAQAVRAGAAAGLDEHDALERWASHQYGEEVARGFAAGRRFRLASEPTSRG